MLVLARQEAERIVMVVKPGTVIPADGLRIEIQIVEIRGGDTKLVRLGIEAPKPVTVHRGEVQQAVDRGEPPRLKRRYRESEHE